jgi:predicted regulator of Ras-like GTPase activity (Roadblock/LC7/MglB family)
VNTQHVSAELASMADTPGVTACALVDSAAGMVYLSAGNHPQIDSIAEAASDYWRMHERSGSPFLDMGPLQAISMIHQDGVLSLMPCGKGIVMATLSERMALDMADWFRKVGRLGRLIGQG